jgi:lysophospholipase L1-like esterase
LILFNVPYANESMFPPDVAKELHAKRDYHNAKLRLLCGKWCIPLADVCSHLHDEHLGDELHPNAEGARIIAAEVFKVLAAVYKERCP